MDRIHIRCSRSLSASRCCHFHCGGRRQALASPSCLFSFQDVNWRKVTVRAAHPTEFIFSRFIKMLPSSFTWIFTFQNAFCGAASFILCWADNLTSRQVSAGNTVLPSLCCAILPSSVFVTPLAFRKEFIWIIRRYGCLLTESQILAHLGKVFICEWCHSYSVFFPFHMSSWGHLMLELNLPVLPLPTQRDFTQGALGFCLYFFLPERSW